METKINIAEILRNKPHGIKLYSPIFGECTFCCVREDTNDICVKKHNGVKEFFDSKGLYYNTGEVMLFPSKEMRDWSKFFKKGDVLVSYEGNKPYYTIFDCFESNNYKDFNGKFAYDSYEEKWYQNEGNLSTNTFHKLSIADSEIYITKIEERFGGKMNHETLEIKNTHPEFKDGDILFVRCDKYSYIEIFNYFKKNGDLYDHASLNITRQSLDTSGILKILKEDIVEIRLATDSEKLQLFDILTKEGKYWDAEKKQIVDLKPKVKFKPFDKIVVFDELAKKWECGMFSHYSKNYKGKEVITCIGGCTYFKVLPFNEETAKLVGTTNNVEGQI